MLAECHGPPRESERGGRRRWVVAECHGTPPCNCEREGVVSGGRTCGARPTRLRARGDVGGVAGVAWSRQHAAPVEGDKHAALDEGADREGEGHEALVLERITGNLWKSFTSRTKRGVAGLRGASGQGKSTKKNPKSTTSCDMFNSKAASTCQRVNKCQCSTCPQPSAYSFLAQTSTHPLLLQAKLLVAAHVLWLGKTRRTPVSAQLPHRAQC